MCVNQTGVGQKFAPPEKAPEKETCIDSHEDASADIVPPAPQFQCCEKRVFGGANFCPENARAHGCPNPCNIEIGGGGEGETKRKQKMWIEQWCELSSDTSSEKSACHRHEATAKANNGCQ